MSERTISASSGVDEVLLAAIADITVPPGDLLIGTGKYEAWALTSMKRWLERGGISLSERTSAPNVETAGVPMGDPHPCDQSRFDKKRKGGWEECVYQTKEGTALDALESAINSLREGTLDEWELQLVKRRLTEPSRVTNEQKGNALALYVDAFRELFPRGEVQLSPAALDLMVERLRSSIARVPAEPTEAMRRAAYDAYRSCENTASDWSVYVYRAMLAAAPNVISASSQLDALDTQLAYLVNQFFGTANEYYCHGLRRARAEIEAMKTPAPDSRRSES